MMLEIRKCGLGKKIILPFLKSINPQWKKKYVKMKPAHAGLSIQAQ